MAQISRLLRTTAGNGLMFWCPGCDEAHAIKYGGGAGDGARWTWSGDAEHPTFRPSVLVRPLRALRPGYTWAPGDPPICHSFVTDGRIQFLKDSTHSLAGQTVDLPPWPAMRGNDGH